MFVGVFEFQLLNQLNDFKKFDVNIQVYPILELLCVTT